MERVVVRVRCPGVHPEEMFRSLADYENLSARASAIRSVEVSSDAEGRRISSWAVNFRRGILVWSQFDDVDETALTIRFTRRDGDPEFFHGSWSVTPDDGGCRVEFDAEFDLGMPGFRDIVDPLAHRTLKENVVAVILDLADGGEVLPAAPDEDA